MVPITTYFYNIPAMLHRFTINTFIIEAITSILYAIRYVVNLRDMAMGSISSQTIFYDEKKDTVKIGLPMCKKMIQKNHKRKKKRVLLNLF